MKISVTKVVVTFYLKLRNDFQPFSAENQASNWLTWWGLVFGRKWLEFISQSQIKGNYNFSNLPESQVCLDEIELKIKTFIFYNSSNRIFKICDFPDKCSLNAE